VAWIVRTLHGMALKAFKAGKYYDAVAMYRILGTRDRDNA